MLIVKTTPFQNADNVGLQNDIIIEFDQNILPDSITQASVTVTTKKTNIVSAKTTGITVDIYDNEEFFDSEFTAIVKGEVFINPNNAKELIFRPSFRLMPNTEYVVYIAKFIAGVDQSILPAIYSVKFKTHQEDIVEPLEYTPGTTILGKNVLPEDSSFSSNIISIVKTLPIDNSIMASGDSIIFDFNVAISKPTSSNILITKSNVFSDDTAIVADFTIFHELSNKRIRIKLPKQFEENCFYSIQLSEIKTSASSETTNFSMGFIAKLNPYYSSVKLIRLKAGSMFNSLTDLHLASIIHFVSCEADVMLTKLIRTPHYNYLRQRWVLYSVIHHLLLNTFDQNAVDSFKKSFGEYSIAITNGSRVKAFNALLNETKQWFRNFDNMLNFKYSAGSFVKGSNAYSEVETRRWARGIQPGLNTRDTESKLMVWDEIGEPTTWEIAERE